MADDRDMFIGEVFDSGEAARAVHRIRPRHQHLAGKAQVILGRARAAVVDAGHREEGGGDLAVVGVCHQFGRDRDHVDASLLSRGGLFQA